MPAPSSLFMERMIRFLMPYFAAITPDLAAARADILETLASYGARTRSEMLSAVQIIAFGCSALDTLAEAKATEMSASQRLRFRGCANNLNRSCQTNEKSLTRQMSCDAPAAAAPDAELIVNISDAEVDEITRRAQEAVETYRNRLTANRPSAGQPATNAARKERHSPIWTGLMTDALGGQDDPASAA
jgi:hypothetical protein